MTSFVLSQRRRSLGRARFAIVFAAVATLVWLLPGVVDAVLSSAFRKAGPDPAMGILSQLLFVSIVLTVLLALLAALTVAARMRLRDLDLSGAFVILFPLIALTPLPAFAAARMTPLMPTAGLGGSPLAQSGVELALLFGLILSVAPGRLAGRPLASSAVDLLRQWTNCEGTIDRSTFRRRAGPTLAVTLCVAPFDRSGLVLAISLVVLVSLSARRLHGLGRTCLLAGVLPLAFSIGAAAGFAAAMLLLPLAFVPGLGLATAAVLPALFVMAIALLVYLFVASDIETPHGATAPRIVSSVQ